MMGVELETRNMKMALRRLRILTREGTKEELDLDKTIDKTSRNAGLLELEMAAAKKNNVKVLLFLDIGGSMDDHIELCSRLFSAAKYEFKHLEHYYFHNCLYESVWRDNKRRKQEAVPTFEMLHTYNSDYKVIIVGDASMSPYEILYPNGSIEHSNDEAGIIWLERLKEHFRDIRSSKKVKAFGISLISQPGWMGSQASPVLVTLGLRYRLKKHLLGIRSS